MRKLIPRSAPPFNGGQSLESSIAEFAMSESKRNSQNERAAARRSCEPPHADGSMRFHRMHQFWELAAGLPVKKVRLSELGGFDEVRWFGGPRNLLPTCRAIACMPLMTFCI
jgi:hypothetical protein